MNHLKTPKVSN